MIDYIFKNNQLIKKNQATISIDERGFLFGDGIFETCKIYNGKVYDYKSHEIRLLQGLKALKISAKINDIAIKINKLIVKNKIKNGIARISITRGNGSVGYLPSKNIEPLIIIQTQDQRKIANKITLNISKIKKPPINSFPINHKTNNALTYILNKINANEEGFFDAIMLSSKNFIAETSAANIFWVKNNKIYTPSKACEILPGTIRKKLLKISLIKIIEKQAKLIELKNADEVFLSNSLFLIMQVDEIRFNNGLVKKFSKKISTKLHKILLDDVEKHCQLKPKTC